MKKSFITLAQFAELISNITGSAFADCESVTEPKLNKKDRISGAILPFNKVLNCRLLNIQLGYNYEKQVNDKAEKQGIDANFEAQEHVWARRIKGALARHKSYEVPETLDFTKVDTNKLYMAYKVQSIRQQSYIADGQQIAKSILTNFFPPKDDYSAQPQDDKVKVQYMKLSSVKSFIFGGTEFIIVS
jgi:hypothetical protein